MFNPKSTYAFSVAVSFLWKNYGYRTLEVSCLAYPRWRSRHRKPLKVFRKKVLLLFKTRFTHMGVKIDRPGKDQGISHFQYFFSTTIWKRPSDIGDDLIFDADISSQQDRRFARSFHLSQDRTKHHLMRAPLQVISPPGVFSPNTLPENRSNVTVPCLHSSGDNPALNMCVKGNPPHSSPIPPELVGGEDLTCGLSLQ